MTPVGELIVGASPWHLVIGIELLTAGTGAGVLIAEAAERPGGAWRTGPAVGVDDLELGCHFLANDADGYAVLERCGVRLAPHEPRPQVLVARPAGATRPDRVKNTVLYALGVVRRRRLLDWARHDAAVAALRRRRGPGSPVAFRFPPGGCGGLVGDLVARFEALGGRLDLGRPITAIDDDPDAGRVRCTDAAGRTLLADRVHLTPNARGIRVAGTSVIGGNRRHNLLLRLAGGPAQPPWSFVFVKGDRTVHAVSDVGRRRGQPVIAVQLRRGAVDRFGQGLVEAVRQRLQALGLLAPEALVTASALEHWTAGGHWPAEARPSSRVVVRRADDVVRALADAERRGVLLP